MANKENNNTFEKDPQSIINKLAEERFKLYTDIIKSDSNIWRIPRDIGAYTGPAEDKKNPSVEEILAPLDEVFIPDSLKDEIITRVSIPQLLDGTEPTYSGIILFGPPGTGKTALAKAIEEVYKRAGAYAQETSLAKVNTPLVGQFAKNLEELLEIGKQEAKKRKKPSFLSFDEGSALVEKSSEGSASVGKHYQEAIDTLKRYIGNNRELIVAVSTNVLPETFEEALTREGRLTSFFIGYPDVEQRGKMWKHLASKNKVLGLTDSQSAELAILTGEEQGAFIEEFCRGYNGIRRNRILKEKGFSTLVAALKRGTNVTDGEIKSTINYETFKADVEACLESKYSRNGSVKEEKEKMGFKRS